MRIRTVVKIDGRRWHLEMEAGGPFLCDGRLKKKMDLREGMSLTETEQAELAAFTKAYAEQCAFRYLGFKRRTESETRKHLEGKGLPEAFAEAVVEMLKRNSLLDDRIYGEDYADELIGKNRSTYEIRMKMIEKGLPDSLAEEILQVKDAAGGEGRRAAVRLEKKFPAGRIPEDRGRMRQFLYRKGFSMDAIHEALRIIDDGRDQ